jgi:ABC-type glutathione transport system ATPase component
VIISSGARYTAGKLRIQGKILTENLLHGNSPGNPYPVRIAIGFQKPHLSLNNKYKVEATSTKKTSVKAPHKHVTAKTNKTHPFPPG